MRGGAPRVASALLLHGAGAGGWEWNAWRSALEARGIACAAPDLQPVAAGLAATRFADYREQALAALSALSRPRAVVGASLGGLLALAVASEADALVLVNAVLPSPWHRGLPARDWPDRVRWGTEARLASTRAALPDADAASALYAFRRWRDESGAVLREAHAGIALPLPTLRTLCVMSEGDGDVPPDVSETLAAALGAECIWLPGASHAGPLLGRDATRLAARVAEWLSAG
jgi:pimeloyl-ACP methyl ester carboxylesterase